MIQNLDSTKPGAGHPTQSRDGAPSLDVELDFRSIDITHFRRALDPTIQFLVSDIHDVLASDLGRR